MSKAFNGAAVLASYLGSYSKLESRINLAQYTVAKTALGLPPRVHVGSQAAVLAECRITVRASTLLLKQIAMTRARVSLLPEGHPTRVAVDVIVGQRLTGTWWQHSSAILQRACAITEFQYGHLDTNDSRACTRALREYKLGVVLPALRKLDTEWFQVQLQRHFSQALVPYSTMLPPFSAWRANERWAAWPPTLWKFHRVWCVVRLTGSLGLLSADGAQLLMLLPQCVWCEAQVTGIRHLLLECTRTQDLRPLRPDVSDDALFAWALDPRAADDDDAKSKLKFVGAAVTRLAEALQLDVAS